MYYWYALISFLITALLVPVFRFAAHSLGMVDHPDGMLKKHHTPTAYLGGVAIYVGLWLSVYIFFGFDFLSTQVFIGTTIALLVGLVDDLWILFPGQKLLGQILSATWLVHAGFWIDMGWPFMTDMMLSWLWIVSLMNAFNLIDVMDGLATSMALCAAIFFAVYAILFKQYLIAMMLAVFIGCLFGFLLYNKPKATIYLGDAGSLFIGSVISIASLSLDWQSFGSLAIFAPVAVLGVPILEVLSLIIIRRWHGIPFYQGSPHHFSNYLRSKGYSSAEVLWVAVLFSLLLFFASLLLLLESCGFFCFATVVAVLLLFWLRIVFK